MAIECIEKKWCSDVGVYYCTYVIDSAEDVAKLPKSGAGSVAIVAGKGGAVYMANASGKWVEL